MQVRLRFTFGGSLVRNARFGDLALHFWRKSRSKRSFWRLGASLVELVASLLCKCSAGKSFSELDSEVASL